MGPKDLSETAREREVFKYYQPTIAINPGAAPIAPRSSRDTALTVLAQLGALRLDARRGIISLVAREQQYIIAEATRTLSLRSADVFETADQLWRGESIGRRDEGPCSVAMDQFTGVVEGDRDHLLVKDMSTDDRFSHLEAVSGSPFMRFCVAVPLLSPRGMVIGAFTVVDDKSRDGISNVELAFMQDIASTIIAHLEANRLKQQHKRAERMIRGLGLFVEGKASLREWWLNTGYKTDQLEVTEKRRQGESMNQQADEEFGVQDVPDDLAASAIASMPSPLAKGRPPLTRDHSRTTGIVHTRVRRHLQDSRWDTMTGMTPSTLPSEATEATSTVDLGVSNTSITEETSIASNEPNQATPQSISGSTTHDETFGAELQEAVLSDKLKETFSRASNLIRESISVDGVLFLDASIGTFGGSSTKAEIESSGPAARNSFKSRASPPSTSSSEELLSSEGMAETSSQKMSGILGYSTSTRSSLNMHEPSLLHTHVSETFLRKLLRRYPHGKIFNFDDVGSLSSSEDEVRKPLGVGIEVTSEKVHLLEGDAQRRKRGKRKMTREAEGQELLRLLPAARCVAFFPLWDSHKERWMAGTLAWTTNPTRILDPEEDLTYLASFGNSVMAEVSRLNASLSSQIKDSFVSSISHELRSPLHGVLASVEFLQDSPLNALQQEMVSIIGSCGRTLLDTLNHVLDFAKLRRTTAGKGKDKKQCSRSRPIRRASASAGTQLSHRATSVDLRILTEEVLEGVYAGSRFGKDTSLQNSQSGSSLPGSLPSFPQPASPMTILDLAWRDNWNINIDPGAWRRLVMNLFGNALKYTESGFVRISLGKSSTDDASLSGIVLTVTDSGKGISKEFLNHHLYTPFAQEDSLAVGSGLGLSIVKHIVMEIGGSIDISSEPDLGTMVTIKLLLEPAMPASPSDDNGVMVHKLREQLRGLEACLVGFDVFPSLGDEPTGILSVEAKTMFYFKDSLTSLLNGWFGLNVSVNSTLDPSPKPISLVTEAVLNELMLSSRLSHEDGSTGRQNPVLLVLCTQPHRINPAIVQSRFHIFHVQPLIGPHKLAQVLERCLPFIIPSGANFSADKTTVGDPHQARIDIPPGKWSPTLPDRPATLRRISSKRSEVSPSTSPSMPSKLGIAMSHEDSYASGSGSPGAEMSSKHVLLVEDNAINLKILVTHMKNLGISYATAQNGMLAVQTYQRSTRPFDLVIMDISMPVMDGLEASRQIRLFEKEARRSRAPIVAITGAASESSRQEAFSAGIDEFFTKPVSLKVIKEMVEAVVNVG